MKFNFKKIFLTLVLTLTTTKVFSISSYTFTTDTDFKNYFSEKKNTIIVGTSQETIILLNNHFEKLSLTNFPSGRHSYTMDSSSQIVVLFGGTPDYINLHNDCWVFDETNKWQRLNIVNSPSPRYGHSIINISDNEFLLFGGLTQQGFSNETYIFLFSSNTFYLVQISTSPQARYYHSMCFVPEENKVYLFGGYNQSGVLNDFWSFDINTKTWQLVQNTTPLQPRFGHKMVYVPKNKKIYIFAGQKGFSSTDFLSDIWSYNITKREWLQVGYLPNPLSNFAISLFDEINQIIIFGGYNGSKYLNDVLFFNYITSTVVSCDTYFKPAARDKFSMVKLNNKFFMFGGTTGYSGLSDSYYLYYSTYGEITSDTIFTYNPTRMKYLSLQFSPPPSLGTDVKFQVAYSTDNKTFSEFLGPDGTPSTFFTSTQQNFISDVFDNKQFIKLKGYFYIYQPPKTLYIDKIVLTYNLAPYPPKLIQIGTQINPIYSSTNTLTPSFIWETATDPENENVVSYRLQISTSTDFANLIVDQSNIPTTYFRITEPLNTGIYFWRVAAKDAAFDESNFSSYFQLEVDTTAPNAPYYLVATPHPTLDKTLQITTKLTGDDREETPFRGSIVVAFSSYTEITEENFDSVNKFVYQLPLTYTYSTGTMITFNLTNLQNNTTYFIALKFRDEALNLSTMSVCISTITNFIPEIKILYPTDDSQIYGDKVQISWYYYDFNTDEQIHTFNLFLINQENQAVTNIATVSNTTYYVFNSLSVKNSTYTLRIEIKDTRGATSYDEVKNIKIVNSNFPPKILSWIKPQQNEILVSKTEINWSIYDPNLADEHFYELFITTDLVSLTKIAEFKNTTSYIFDTTLFLNDTNYYLILKVEDEGGLFDISTSPVFAIKNNNLPPSKPKLLYPKNFSYTSPYKVKFLWEASVDPNINDKIFYDFYLSTTSDFKNIVFEKYNLTDTQIEISYPTIDEQQTYFWRVKAKDMFNTENSSEIQTFFTYPRYKAVSEDNKVYAELLEIPKEKIFVYIKKVANYNERTTHPVISLADKKDKIDRFIKILPYDVYDINLYDENFNLVENVNLKYKIVFGVDEEQYELPKQAIKISYLNPQQQSWEFTEYKQNFVEPKNYSITTNSAIETYSDKFGFYTVIAKSLTNQDVSDITVYPNPFNPEVQEVIIEYVLTKDVDIDCYILTLSGGLVKKLHFEKGIEGISKGSPEGKRNKFSWDGRNDKGSIVSVGMYVCKLVFGNQIVYKHIGVVKK
jgi:N-acetylneuraminic acid mutarotase